MSQLTLFHGSTSVCSQKVRLAFAEIEVPYESRLLDLQMGDQFAPEYMVLNPNAVVPTLVDNGLVVLESSLIIEYLDREYNGGKLMPEDKVGQVAARHWLLRCLDIHAAINALTFATVGRDRILSKMSPQEISDSTARIPNPIARERRRDLIEHGLGAVPVKQALMHLERCLADMSISLGRGDWLSGDIFGITDIALLPYIDRLDRLSFSGLWEDQNCITGWLTRMRQRQSYADAVENFIEKNAAVSMKAAGKSHWRGLAQEWNAKRKI